MAVDSSGRLLLLNGHGWTAPAVPKVDSGPAVNSLVDVSCPLGRANFCAAVDASSDAWTTKRRTSEEGPALRAGISTFERSRFMGARLTMIDRHYGHLARDGREHAIKLLDALNAPEFDPWTLVDGES